MSFALTTDQFKAQSKTVTRRLGWKGLKPGTRLMGCTKCQGLKPGEQLERLGEIEVVSVRREPLQDITQEDVEREGFPELRPSEFVGMFCSHMGCEQWEDVTRIEFRYVDGARPA
jgi:hypothetical protein